MTKNEEKHFQDSVDEWLVLEQRADRRAQKLIELTNDYQEKTKKAFEHFQGKVEGIEASLARMNAASYQIQDYIAYCEKQALRTAKLFLGTVVACALCVAGTLWWSHHLMSGLAKDKADLSALDIKLKHTPVIVHFKGNDYVRVVPDSETGFTRGEGSEMPGRYAKVWHER